MVDSLQVFEILKSGSLPEAQARAMTLAIKQAESEMTLDVKTVMEREFAAFRGKIDGRFNAFGASIDAKLAETKSEILRWNFVFWVAQLAAMAAMLKLLK